MRVSSIPNDLEPVKAIKVTLPPQMQNKMRLSFYKEGDTFQTELKQKARALKVDVQELYVNLLFFKVYDARTKFIDQKRDASFWDVYYTLSVNMDDAQKIALKKQLGLANEPAA